LTRYVSGRAPSWLPENIKPFSRKMAKISVMMEDAFFKREINIYAFWGRPAYLSWQGMYACFDFGILFPA
jgi:hypothetical protein